MRWKIFQWMKLLFRHSSNSRKLSRQKFHNELACVFTAHYASKNADWNQQQLTDGGILVNWNSANHPYCFLSNQKKVQIPAFLHVIRQRNVSCPHLVRGDNRDNRERASSQANNSEAPSSSLALTACWICSRSFRVQILGHACIRHLLSPTGISAINTVEGK